MNHGHHQVRDELGEQAPEVSFDYCSFRDQPGGDSLPVLVGCDRASRSVIAHAAPCNGDDVCRNLERLGHYGRLTLRSNHKPTLATLRSSSGTVLEQQMDVPSRAHFCGILRVHKLALESRLGERISVLHGVLPWLIEFVTTVMNQHLVGKDGRTAIEFQSSRASWAKGGFHEYGWERRRTPRSIWLHEALMVPLYKRPRSMV